MNKYMENARALKVLSIISFAFILFSLLIVAWTEPVDGYEISLYDVYPWYFWMSLSIPMILSFIAILLNIKTVLSKYVYVILASGFFSLIILLSIPVFRGYAIYGEGDVLSHLGMIKDIAMQGHIGASNPYPIIHLLIYTMSRMTNMSPEALSLYINQIFILLYLVSMFALARSLKCEWKETLLIVACAVIPLLGYWLTIDDIIPSTEAYFMLPLAIFCIIKTVSYQDRSSFIMMPATANQRYFFIISLIVLALFPVFHPEVTLFLFVTLLIIVMTLLLSRIVKNSFKIDDSISTMNNEYLIKILALVSALLIIFFIWTLINASVNHAVSMLFDAITFQFSEDTPVLLSLVNNGIKISYIDALQVLIRTYGAALVVLMISAIMSLFTLLRVIKKIKVTYRDFFLASLFFIFIALNIIFFIIGTPIGFHIYRQIKYPLFVSTLIFGITLYRVFRQNKHGLLHSFVSLFLLIAIIITPVLAVFNMYSSPSIHGINYQVTTNDVSSMDFFFSHRIENNLIYEPIDRNYQGRFSSYLQGYRAIEAGVRSGYIQDALTPAHFGYGSNISLGDLLTAHSYVLLYPPSKEYYPEIYPNYKSLWMYTSDDFNMLVKDTSISRFYDSGDLNLYLTGGTNLWSGGMGVYNNIPDIIHTSVETLPETYNGHYVTRVTYTPLTSKGVDIMKTYLGKGICGSNNTYLPDTDYTATIYFRCNESIIVSGVPSSRVKWDSQATEDLGDGWKKATIHHNSSQLLTDNKYWGFTISTAGLNEPLVIDWAYPKIEITPNNATMAAIR
jgi:hypothetical protein